MKKSVRARIGAAGAAIGASVALMVAATPAHAGTWKVTDNCDVPWINCTEGDLFVFYNSKAKSYNADGSRFTTSWATFYGNVDDYYGSSQYQGSTLNTYRYVFNGNGTGAGQYMKNNGASVQNCAGDNYRIYYSSGYGGTSQYFKNNGGWGCSTHTDLISALQNNNASQHFA